jgi:hypothetical protein
MEEKPKFSKLTAFVGPYEMLYQQLTLGTLAVLRRSRTFCKIGLTLPVFIPFHLQAPSERFALMIEQATICRQRLKCPDGSCVVYRLIWCGEQKEHRAA